MGLHDSLLQNVIGAKILTETWDCLLKVYETNGLANKLFLRCHFFAYKVNPMDSMLDHINKIKYMFQQLEAIGEKLEKSDVVMVLLCSLPNFQTNMIITLESRADANFMIDYVTTKKFHEELKRKGVKGSNEGR